MKRFGSIAALAIVATLIAATADARPQYPRALGKAYPKAADALKTAKCGACHGKGGKNKKVVSVFGAELKKALGEKNVKDKEKIMAAIKTVAEVKNEDGKTYGELLEAGKLPAPAEE